MRTVDLRSRPINTVTADALRVGEVALLVDKEGVPKGAVYIKTDKGMMIIGAIGNVVNNAAGHFPASLNTSALFVLVNAELVIK